MNRRLLTSVVLGLAVAATGCRSGGGAGGPATPKHVVTPLPSTPPTPSRAAYEAWLDELLPGLGAADITERERPQQDLEHLCFLVGRPGAEDERRWLCEAMGARVGAGVPLPARTWLLRQLERLSGEESVVVLDCLLHDEEPQVRDLARRCLQANPSPLAGEALRIAFDETEDADWRIALANSFGARRDEKAIPPMLALVYRDRYEPTPVAAAVVMALGDIAGPESQHWLSYFWLGGAPDILRPAIADALLRCAELDLAEGHEQSALATYELLIGYTGPEHIRLGALRGLARAKGHEALPTLLSYILDDKASATMRAWAATLTRDIPGFATTATLAAKLPEASAAACVLLLNALGERGDASALPAVLPQLDAEHGDVRIAALTALGALGDANVARTLAQAAARAAEHGDAAEHDAARRSLATLRGEGVDEAVQAALDDAPAAVRVELIVALRERNCVAAVPALLAQARDASPAVRAAACEALGALAAPDAAADLVALLVAAAGDEEEVRQAAEDAVVAVCGRLPDEARRSAPLLSAWTETPPAVAATLLRVLGRVGGPPALERVRAARRSTEPRIADAAVRALAAWSSADVLDDLLDLAQHADDAAQRILALRGYARLVGLPSERPPAQTIEMYQTAMKLAEQPEERRLVLAGLGAVRHPDVLGVLEAYLNDSELRGEAEAAVVSAATLIGPRHRDLARAALLRISETTATDATRRRAENALANLRRYEGRLIEWVAAGPYEQAGRDWFWLLDHVFPPEQAGGDVQWRPLDPTSLDKPWTFDLRKACGGEQRCVYVRSAVWSPERREVRLEVGSDDAVKAWLNGKLVHELRETRGHTPFQDRVRVTLDAGWNTVLLKVVQAGGEWAFSCAVRAVDGEPPDGLRFAATPAP